LITDDGRGFDTRRVPGYGNYGITIMHERVESINGAINLISSPGEGTRVSLQVPLATNRPAGGS
jgi:signal transduction histidine kinase